MDGGYSGPFFFSPKIEPRFTANKAAALPVVKVKRKRKKKKKEEEEERPAVEAQYSGAS